MKLPKNINLFLGAGASLSFGFPTTRLFIEDFKQVVGKNPEAELLEAIMKNSSFVDAEHVLQFLDTLESLKSLRRAEDFFRSYSTGVNLHTRQVNFLELLDVSARLRDKLIDDIYRQYEFDDNRIDLICRTYKPLINLLYSYKGVSELSIFSTNYDCSIENLCYNSSSMKLIDGFIDKNTSEELGLAMRLRPEEYGWYPNIFDEEVKGDSKIKLYKLHGSLNWRVRYDDKIVKIAPEQRIGESKQYKKNLVIYPAEKVKPEIDPYKKLHELFVKSYTESEITIFIGFAFRDEYLNSIFRQAPESKKIIIISPHASELTKSTLNKSSGIKATFYPISSQFGNNETISQLEETLAGFV